MAKKQFNLILFPAASRKLQMHFNLHCPLYDLLHGDFLDELSDVPGLDIASISNMDDDTLYH